ncbi:hypothetical protein Ddc_24557 [Ditylenchus destructor]|nr:hypothetical protein Ddc_24557 [Ditylenchus destructor]
MNILYTALGVFMLFGTFGCSLFVLTKIRKMQKLVGHVSQKGTFNDLRRASFVCLFQASSYTIYSILLIYMRLYAMGIISMEDSTPLILRILLHAFTELQNPMFLLFAIIDTVIPMILLRSYRRTIRYLCLKPYRMVVGRKTMSVIVSTDLTPRINNLVK